MSRRKQPSEPPSSTPNAASGPQGASGGTGGLLPLAVMLGGLAFFAYFFLAHPLRPLVAAQLFAPVTLIAQWWGEAGSRAGLFDRFPPLLAVAAWSAAAYGYGAWLLRGLGSETVSRLAFAVLAIGGGLNLLSTLVLLVGWYAGGFFAWSWLLGLVVVLGVLLAGLHIRRPQLSDASDKPDSAQDLPAGAWPRPLAWLLECEVAVILCLSLPYLLGGLLPPWDFDVREYHLQAPREWFEQRRIDFLPHNVYANMPLGVEMHALAGAWLLQDLPDGVFTGLLAGKLITALFAPLTALLLLAAGNRFLSRGAGLAAAIVFLLHPWTAHVALSGLNDVAYGFYALAAVYLLLEQQSSAPASASGYFAGAAAACKYPGAVFVAVPLCLLQGALSCKHRGSKRAVVAASAFLLAALFGGGAWYAKNALLAGNPVYPLAGNWLGGRSRTPERIAQWNRAHQVPVDAQGRSYSLGQLSDSLRSFALTSDYAGPLLAPLALLGGCILLWSALRKEAPLAPAVFCGAFVWLFVSWWLFTHRIDRFLAAAVPFAALLAGTAVVLRNDLPWRVVMATLLGLGGLYGLLELASVHPADNRWFVALEQLRDDRPPALEASAVPPPNSLTRISHAAHLVHHQITNPQNEWRPTDAILLVGDARPLDFRCRAFYNTCFDACLLVEWLENRSDDEQRASLKARGVRLVVLDWAEIGRYRSPGNYGYDPRLTPEFVQTLVDQGVLELLAEWGEPRALAGFAAPLPAGRLYRVAEPKN